MRKQGAHFNKEKEMGVLSRESGARRQETDVGREQGKSTPLR